MPAVTIRRLVATLRKVPEKHLAIMDLVPKLVDDKGKVDIARCLDRQPEVNLALIEVQSYINATRSAARALSSIGSAPPSDFEEEDIDVAEDET